MKYKDFKKLKSNSEIRVYLNKLKKHFRKSNYRNVIYV